MTLLKLSIASVFMAASLAVHAGFSTTIKDIAVTAPPVVNDGYLKVFFHGYEGTQVMVCPRGSHLDLTTKTLRCIGHFSPDGKPVTPQRALDLAFGKDKVKLVGLAPFHKWGQDEEVVLFYQNWK